MSYNPMQSLPNLNEPGPGGIVPGPEAGQLWIPTIGWVDVKAWTQEPYYDTELITTPIAAGDEYIFFRNLSFPTGVRKDDRFTNMTMSSQLPSGWQAIVYHISFRVLQMETAVAGIFTTPEDVQRILSQGVARFIVADQKTEKRGPLEMWPCPFGMVGYVTRTGPAATTWSAVSNGLPSMASVPPNDIVINLVDELTFEARVVFRGAMNLDNDTYLQCLMLTWTSKQVR